MSMIIAIGEALIDCIASRDDSGRAVFLPVPGGSPYNAAVALARLGVSTDYVARISTDLHGDMLLRHLEANGVGTTNIVRTDETTTLSFVQQNDDGEPRYAFYANNTADRNLIASDLPKEIPAESRYLLCGSISLLLEPVGSTIEQYVLDSSAGRFISFDPNIRPSMVVDETPYRARLERLTRVSTLVKLSDEDLEWIFPTASIEEGASSLLDRGAGTVVVTRGGKGCELYQPGRRISAEATRVAAGGDTVGAGDTFHAALLSWLVAHDCSTATGLRDLSDDAIRDLLRFAGLAASITCSRTGADPPYRDEMT